MELFRDTYEGTEFDMVKDLTVVDDKGKTVKSPLANPFMPYEMNKLLKNQRRLGLVGRTVLGPLVLHVRHSRSPPGLPDAAGGIVWFGYGNPAMTLYVPLYAGIDDLPESYRTDGRTTGFSRRAGVVGLQSGGEVGGASLGRHAPRRGQGPRSAAREVSHRPEGRGGEGPPALRRGSRRGPRLSHRQVCARPVWRP